MDIKPPKKDKEFVKYWNMYIEDVLARNNVKQGHLRTLEIFCDMNVEHDFLLDDISFNGYTYLSTGRNGDQQKIRPEVQQANRVRSEIRAYANVLGLALVKDTLVTAKDKEPEW